MSSKQNSTNTQIYSTNSQIYGKINLAMKNKKLWELSQTLKSDLPKVEKTRSTGYGAGM